MKKILVFITALFTFSFINVNALDISIDSVKVKDKSDNTVVGDTKIEGLTLTPNIEFKNAGDSVTYEVTLKSNDKNAYQIKSITDNNSSGIKTTYSYDKDLSKPVLITMKYTGESFDKVDISIEVEEVKNPKTGASMIFFIISIALVWTYAIIDTRKNKRFSKALILAIFLLPITSVFAAEKITIVLKGEGITLPASIEYVNRQVEGVITPGDELAIKDEHFYVVSSNNEETVLLSKYNLYVGDIYDVDTSTWKYTYQRSIASTEEGYGMQNEHAKAALTEDSHWVGTVPFSSKTYWWDSVNNSLYSQYDSTEEFKNNIYDKELKDNCPQLTMDDDSGPRYIEKGNNQNYSVANYVEGYVDYLYSISSLSEIKGRLLLFSEAEVLGCSVANQSCEDAPSWLKQTSYWIGTNVGQNYVIGIKTIPHYIDASNYKYSSLFGVRPVIVLKTIDVDK